MSRGFNISAGAHGLLALWLLLGPVFRPDPPEMTVADVSVISEAEYAALTAPREGPQTEPAPAAPEAPEETPAPPSPPPPSDTRPPARPEPPAPTPDAQPDSQPAEPPAPAPPVAEVQDAPPDPLPAPPAAPEVAAPESDLPPTPRDAPRVALEAVAPPPPEAVPDEAVQQAADPEAESPDVAEAEQESTAPEEATTEIVTEAERPAAAPNASVRPLARPERQVAAVQPEPEPEPAPEPEPEPVPEPEPEPAPAPEPEPEPEPEPAPQEVPSDDIAAALAEAMSGGQGTDPAPQAPAGPPLTPGEREGLRLAVQRCWVVDVGSQAASVTVVVGFDLQPDGRPVEGSVRLLDSTGGSGAAADAAYSAARRAILRCAAEQNGFDLPSDKYDQWKTVEMTFNPEQMRTR